MSVLDNTSVICHRLEQKNWESQTLTSPFRLLEKSEMKEKGLLAQRFTAKGQEPN